MVEARNTHLNSLSDQSTNPRRLTELRQAISQLDQSLLDLLAKRQDLVYQVADFKQQSGKAVRDKPRENELLAKIIAQGKQLNLDSRYITQVFHLIIKESVKTQQAYLAERDDVREKTIAKIAVLGGEGSYSCLAAKRHFARQTCHYQGFSSFDQVVDSVALGLCDFALLPIENTTSGGITEVYDLMVKSDLTIVGEEKYPIRHCLVAAPLSELHQIRVVHAHPEAKKQCKQNLQRFLDLEISLVSSTSKALELVKKDPLHQVAAIASLEAAEQMGLRVLLDDLADLEENTTRFWVVAKPDATASRQTGPRQTGCKTSIALITGQKPGALADVLQIFKTHHIPLSKLESRPIPDQPWQQLFHLDIYGHSLDENLTSALKQLAEQCSLVKNLGSYPCQELDPALLLQS